MIIDISIILFINIKLAFPLQVVDLLVTMGEDVDGKGQDGSTPLRCAVQVFFFGTAITGSRQFVMNTAIFFQEGHTSVVKILLDKGASLTDKVTDEFHELKSYRSKFQDEDGLTVLHCAAGEGHGTIVSTLLASAPWLANEQTRW